MPIDRGDDSPAGDPFREDLDRVLADLPEGDRPAADEPLDRPSFALGVWMGLERPEDARRLLDRLVPAAPGSFPVAASASASASTASSLLARSAALPLEDLARLGPDVVFGWAGGLAPATVMAIGRVVRRMLEAGSPKDVGRGFGLAWDGGVGLPHRDLDAMLRAFTALEVVVAGVLAGRDLRVGGDPAPRPGGLGGLLSAWIPRKEPGETQAAAVLDRGGEDARWGLIALWNAWMAVRYRSKLPEPTFELLARPWVTVVGPLPPA